MLLDSLLLLTYLYLVILVGLGFNKIVTVLIKAEKTYESFWLPILYGNFCLGAISLLLNFFTGVYTPFTYFALIILAGLGAIDIIRYPLKSHFSVILFSLILLPWMLSLCIGHDGGLYHLPYQLWLRQEKIVFGLANFHGRFGFSSFQNFIQAPLWLGENFKILSFSVTVFFTALFVFLWDWINSKETNKLFVAISIIITVALFNNYTLLRNITYTDNSSGILFVLAFLTGLNLVFSAYNGHKISDKEVFQLGFLSLFAVMLKLSTAIIALWLIAVIIILYNKKVLSIYNLVRLNIINLVILFVWLAKNIIISGCLLYPFSFSCIGLSWSAKANAIRNTD